MRLGQVRQPGQGRRREGLLQSHHRQAFAVNSLWVILYPAAAKHVQGQGSVPNVPCIELETMGQQALEKMWPGCIW